MITIQDVEQFIPFIKPFFDGLRSIKDFLKRDHKKSREHYIDIPKQTLILLPDARPFSLRWSLGKAGTMEAMHLYARLQATNTSKFNIRPSGLKLLKPHGVEIHHQMLFTSAEDNLIPRGAIGDLSFSLFISPILARQGMPLTVVVSIQDQFGNEHVAKDLIMRYAGPETPKQG